jgi:PAS domain S-box-containing protein
MTGSGPARSPASDADDGAGPSRDDAVTALQSLAAAFERAVLRPPAEARAPAAAAGASELRYRNLVEQIPAVVFTAALDGGLYDLYVGPQIETLLGYTQEEWLRSPVLWYERLHPDDRRKLDQEFARGCATGGPFKAECRFLARDGHVVWVHGEARLINDPRGFPLLLQGVAFDISEAKRAEETVRASLREKELLLKEIHHRVKNNLQITSSLLRLQLARVVDKDARRMLQESQDRIRSMALVHEMLYRSPDLSRVDFGQYARSLIQLLFRSHNADTNRIAHRVSITDIVLGIDVAMPLGLIVNELVANSLKYAFPEGRRGSVEVGLDVEPGRYRLRVKDDGVGIPEARTSKASADRETLGLRLVDTLVDQIGGRLELDARNGTEFVVTFPQRMAAR